MLQTGSLTKTVLSGTNMSWLLLINEDKPALKPIFDWGLHVTCHLVENSQRSNLLNPSGTGRQK